MSGAHDHPEVAALDAALAHTVDRVAALAARVAALEEPPPPPSAFDYAYLGKPADDQTVGTKWTELDQSRHTPPRPGLEHTLVYLNVDNPVGVGVLRLRIVRADGDATAYCDFDIDGPRLITYTYFEAGDGKPTHVELRCREGLESVTLSTRYRKVATVVA